MTETDTPDPGKLADADDELDWDRAVHGRMVEQQTPDDTVQTVPFIPQEA